MPQPTCPNQSAKAVVIRAMEMASRENGEVCSDFEWKTERDGSPKEEDQTEKTC